MTAYERNTIMENIQIDCSKISLNFIVVSLIWEHNIIQKTFFDLFWFFYVNLRLKTQHDKAKFKFHKNLFNHFFSKIESLLRTIFLEATYNFNTTNVITDYTTIDSRHLIARQLVLRQYW